MDTLNELVKVFKKKIVFSVHPRTRDKLVNFDLQSRLSKNIIQSKPLGFNDYIKLQKNSFCVISDSGTISEESSILHFPAITVRQSHERPEAMDQGTVIMTGFIKKNIIDSIKIVSNSNAKKINTAKDYTDQNISEKVVRIIFSHVDYINRNTWKKY